MLAMEKRKFKEKTLAKINYSINPLYFSEISWDIHVFYVSDNVSGRYTCRNKISLPVYLSNREDPQIYLRLLPL